MSAEVIGTFIVVQVCISEVLLLETIDVFCTVCLWLELNPYWWYYGYSY